MEDFFNNRENEGRKKLKDLFTEEKGYEVAFTDNPYERYDALLTGKTGEYVVEIKDVHRDFKQYDDFAIDASKIYHLKATAYENNKKALLVGFFDDYDIVWDVTYMNPPITDMYCTTTTADYQHGNKLKKMCHLTEEDATYKRKHK